MEFDVTLAAGLVLTAGLVAMAALLAMSALSMRLSPRPESIFAMPTPATVFVFDGEALVDATPPARAMIAAEGQASAWARALSKLEPLFPGLSLRMEGLEREGRFVLCSREDVEPPLVLRAENLGGLTRLTLMDTDTEQRQPGRDGAADVALDEELLALRQTLAVAPMPIWRTSGDGAVVWANGAYLKLAADLLEPGKELGWPLPQLFPPTGESAGSAKPAGQSRRVIRAPSGERWFEVQAVPAGRETVNYAEPADKVVQAEASLRDFMQTLTKTFAQLPIGLAIFDRNRVLQLFNPALIDLTALPAEFLISRPTLPMLLDAMRERQMIPEPKDYRSWRRKIVELEEAAASGLFEDTWSLPSGQTYRVTGRPHPNGALAFLFEDISTEMMRTRRYRADLELGQAVIDAMPDAVVVFAQDGGVLMTNAAAALLWGEGLAGLSAGRGEPGPIALWREMSAPTLLWNDLADFIGTFGPREAWQGEVRLTDGRLLELRVSAVPHGATLVTFRPVTPRPAEVAGDGPGQAIMIA